MNEELLRKFGDVLHQLVGVVKEMQGSLTVEKRAIRNELYFKLTSNNTVLLKEAADAIADFFRAKAREEKFDNVDGPWPTMVHRDGKRLITVLGVEIFEEDFIAYGADAVYDLRDIWWERLKANYHTAKMMEATKAKKQPKRPYTALWSFAIPHGGLTRHVLKVDTQGMIDAKGEDEIIDVHLSPRDIKDVCKWIDARCQLYVMQRQPVAVEPWRFVCDEGVPFSCYTAQVIKRASIPLPRPMFIRDDGWEVYQVPEGGLTKEVLLKDTERLQYLANNNERIEVRMHRKDLADTVKWMSRTDLPPWNEPPFSPIVWFAFQFRLSAFACGGRYEVKIQPSVPELPRPVAEAPLPHATPGYLLPRPVAEPPLLHTMPGRLYANVAGMQLLQQMITEMLVSPTIVSTVKNVEEGHIPEQFRLVRAGQADFIKGTS